MSMSRKQKKNLIRIIVSLVLLAAAWIVTATLLPDLGIWNLLIFAVPYLVAGYDVLLSAGRNILHGQIFDEKFLMALATLGAFVLGVYVIWRVLLTRHQQRNDEKVE